MCWWLHRCIYLTKLIKVYVWNGHISSCVNYISIKLNERMNTHTHTGKAVTSVRLKCLRLAIRYQEGGWRSCPSCSWLSRQSLGRGLILLPAWLPFIETLLCFCACDDGHEAVCKPRCAVSSHRKGSARGWLRACPGSWAALRVCFLGGSTCMERGPSGSPRGPGACNRFPFL